MPSFLTYYDSIKDRNSKGKERKLKGDLLNKMANEFGISYVTVTQKLTKLRKGNDTFTKLEKEKLSEMLSIPVSELFPDSILQIS